MKSATFCMAILIASMRLIGPARAEEEQPAPNPRLELEMVDGSRVIGVPVLESVSLQTSYARMEIALQHILAIKMAEDHETASIDLRNGDHLKGAVHLEAIELGTLFGKISVDLEHVSSMRVCRETGSSLPIQLSPSLAEAPFPTPIGRIAQGDGGKSITISVPPPSTVMLDPVAGGRALQISDRLTPGMTYRIAVEISGDSGGPTRSMFMWQGGFQDSAGQNRDAEYLCIHAGKTYLYKYPDNGRGAGPLLYVFFADAHNASDNSAAGQLTFQKE